MLMSKALSRVTRSVGRRSMVLLSSSQKQHQLPILSNKFVSFSREGSNQFAPTQVSLFHHSALSSSPFQRFGFSSASPEENEKENVQENNGSSANAENEDLVSEETKETGVDSESQSGKRRRGTKRTAFSDSDSDSEDEEGMSAEELAKLLGEKEELLKLKHKEIEQMQDKVLRTYAEMENVTERTKREAENSKKFAIQHFAKHLLDVADNLGRASSVVRESFAKIDTSKGTDGVLPILKTLLEGVEMTEKQLSEVLKKHGVEKFDPTNEPFDPHRHNAVFQVPDASKPPGTVAHVLKAGYLLHDRVIRPAEVGVTQEVENDEETNNSETNNQ